MGVIKFVTTANQIYDLCASRFRLHKSVYNHKSAKAIEYMIMAAEPVLKFARHIDKPKKFLYLTDHIMSEILSSDNPVFFISGSHVFSGIGGVAEDIQADPEARFIQMCRFQSDRLA